MTKTSTGVAAVALAVMVAGTAERAFAQAGWLGPPVQISSASGTLRSVIAPDVAADHVGNAVAVWWEQDSSYRSTVFSARFDAATSTWGAPRRLSDAGVAAVLDTRVAMDAAGNAVAMWSQSAGSDWSVYSARYTASTGTWSTADIRSTGSASGVRLAMNRAGDAVAAWSVFGTFTPGPLPGVYVTRYVSFSGTWTAPERLGPSAQTGVPGIDAGIDDAGNAIVLWYYTAVEVRRFAAASGVWSPAQALSATLPSPPIGGLLPVPRLAVNAAGDAVVSWTNGGVVEVARYQAGGSTWTPAAPISRGSDDSQRGAIDSAGNVVVAWHHNSATVRTLQASRFEASTLSWSPVRDLAPPGAPIPLVFNYGAPAMAIDSNDNVLVLASRSPNGSEIRLVSSFFARATGAWNNSADLTPAGREARLPALAADGSGGATAVWFELAGVSTYQAMRWSGVPAAPSVTTVAPSPGSLSIGFDVGPVLDPSSAPTTLDYSLDGGTTWTPRLPAGLAGPLVLTGLSDGTRYTLRLRMVNAIGRGQASPAIGVSSGIGGAPDNFRVVARNGNRLTFAWTAPVVGLVPTSYELLGGVGTQVLASVPTGGAAAQVTLDVPAGTFFVRVAGAAGSARSLPSSDLTVTVGTTGVPASPSGLLGSASGSSVLLSWVNGLDNAPPDGAVLQVSGSATVTIPLGASESFSFGSVPPGTYTFSVASVGGGGVSPSSPPVTLTFPGNCSGAPNPPTAFSASTQGGVAYLDWLPPSSGDAVASYVVSVSGAYVGSFQVATRTLAVPVRPGRYTLTVTAQGLCGTSAPTPAQTVVVSGAVP